MCLAPPRWLVDNGEAAVADLSEAFKSLSTKKRLGNSHQNLRRRINTPRAASGDTILRNIEKTLDRIGDGEGGFMKRHEDQRRFHRVYLDAMLPLIYPAREWSSCAARVMRERKLKRIHTEVACSTPRRWGKSVAMGMLVAAILVHVPGIRVGIFAQGSRASVMLAQKVREYISRMEGADKFKALKNSSEEFYLHTPYHGNLPPSKMRAYPAGIDCKL